MKRSKRANRWYNPIEEIFEGNLEKECIEESCDFYEMNEIDDNWVISREKWEFYQKCHEKINDGRVCGDKDYNCKERIQIKWVWSTHVYKTRKSQNLYWNTCFIL